MGKQTVGAAGVHRLEGGFLKEIKKGRRKK
jgi:hypothetical protein